MAEKRQHIDEADKVQIGALLRRIEAARNFPTNTDPCVRHVQIMGETLGAGHPYPMLDEERGHCAISLLSVVAALYEARNALGLAPSADAERLDWLQGFADVRLEAWFADGDITSRVTHNGHTIGSGRNLREAIDAARAACPRGPADAGGVATDGEGQT